MVYSVFVPLHAAEPLRGGAPSVARFQRERVGAKHAVPIIHGHFGMNESTPTTALPSTSRAGLTLYWSKINRTPTAIAAVSAPKIAPFAMVKQPASRRPIVTGASPC